MNYRQFFVTNKWWGKILGGFFGYLIARHVGAFFGVLIGNFFDKGLAMHFAKPAWPFQNEKSKELQAIFFETCLAVMGHLAKADGRVSENEIAAAKQLMKELLVSRAQKKMAVYYFNEGKTAGFDLKKILETFQKACHGNRALLKFFIDIQYRFAQIDGLTTKKIKILDTIFDEFGFSPLYRQHRFYSDFGEDVSREQKNSSSSSSYREPIDNELLQAYVLLDISQTASKQEVKRAYRRLMSQNHPDKLIAKGLSKDRIKIANEKTQKITRAYDVICKKKGW